MNDKVMYTRSTMNNQSSERKRKKLDITDNNFVEEAEKVILRLQKMHDEMGREFKNNLTTSKIRNLLSMTADIYNEILNYSSEELNDTIKARIDYLKIRVIYEAGRESDKKNKKDRPVRNFIEEAQIIEQIDAINGKRSRYITFSHYMEALVAYHKYYGGKE